jgi:Tol biopolymer transport system component/serine/threonine protein kinase
MVAQGEILSGRYLLKGELGAGGMGTVYRAVDLRTGADVAVKVPHPFLVRDKEYIDRLRREAQIAASLHSPRIALVTDFADHEGMPYLVMEFVPGETLADLLHREGALSVGDALHIAVEVARALDAAHQRGISHRDLKPQNVHVDEGDIKVLDFGIARIDGQRGLTTAGTIVGSPEYLAPERAEGSGDIRSDIYSLGIVLYQMLTGRVPFDGGTPWTVIRRHITEPPPPLPYGLPPVIYPLVERCLAKRPEDRYQTPRDLANALQDALRIVEQQQTARLRLGTPPATPVPSSAMDPTVLMPVPLPTTGATPRPAATPAPSAPNWSSPPTSTPVTGVRRAPPVWMIAAGVAVVVVLAVLAFVLTRGGSEPKKSDITGTSVVTTTPDTQGVKPDTTVAPGPPPALTVAAPAEGAQLPVPVQLEVKAVGVVLKPPAAGDPAARHLHYFLDTDPAAVLGPGQPVPTGNQNIIHTAETTQSLNLTPGKHTVWVVMTDNNHIPLSPSVQAKVSFTVTGTPLRTADQAPLVYQSLQDGKWRLLRSDGTGRNAQNLTTGSSDDIEPAWSPDGGRIVFVSNRDGQFHLWLMNADGSGVLQLTRGSFNDRNPAWSADGAQIAFSSDRDGGRDQLFVMPAAGGDARQITRGAGGGAEPSWSPDGKQIAFYRSVGDVTQIFVVDAAGGEPKQLTKENARHIDPAWSPDGRRIAYSESRGDRWDIFIMNPDGSDPRQLTNQEVNRHPAWSPDSRALVFASGREGQQQIFVLPLDGQTSRITEGLTHKLHPSWPRK